LFTNFATPLYGKSEIASELTGLELVRMNLLGTPLFPEIKKNYKCIPKIILKNNLKVKPPFFTRTPCLKNSM
jgi:hypothetical protein